MRWEERCRPAAPEQPAAGLRGRRSKVEHQLCSPCVGTLGIKAHAARTLAQAEALLDGLDQPPDIIIADYTLARGERGTDAIASAQRRGTPIAVLVTGDTSAARLAEAQRSGAQLLHKPIDPRVLVDLLAKAVTSL